MHELYTPKKRSIQHPRAALPRRFESGRSSSFALPDYTIIFQLLLFLKDISCCKRRQLLDIGFSGRHHQGDEFASLLGQEVAVRSLDFSYQSMAS